MIFAWILPTNSQAACFDLALLAFWDVAEGFLPAIRNFSPETKIVVDSIDLHFLRFPLKLFWVPARIPCLGLSAQILVMNSGES